VIHETGDWSVWLLIATLAATPLRLAFPRAAWALWLKRRRRDLGVATFGYALFHLLVYLVHKADPGLILREGLKPELLVGWMAFVVFAALAATSNNLSVRRLGRRWGTLHKLVYPAAALTLAHWLLTAFEPAAAILHAGLLAAVVAARVGLDLRRRRARAPTSG
jgi:sulfoxide reductase heme-binding subunit YedZ